jgi:hypothetical protein
VYQWINPAAFSLEPLGSYGNAGHYMLRTPGYFDIDSALSRTFKATERTTIDLRVEAFNVLNHPNFGGATPSTGVGLGPNVSNPTSSTFGRITAAGDQRIMQGAFKIIF